MDRRGIVHRLAKLATPILISNITSIAVPTVVVAFVGNVGSAAEIAAIGLGNVFCNVTGRSVMWGLAGAMDTLSTQAWGAKNYVAVGATARLALLVLLFCATLPMTALWCFAGRIMRAASIDADVADLVQRFAWYTLPSLFCQTMIAPMQKSLYALGQVTPCALALAVSTIMGVVAAYLAIFGALGFDGAALALVVQNASSMLLLMAHCHRDPQCRRCWDEGWTRRHVRAALSWPQWQAFLRLGVPSCLMMCVEWWSWEIATFMVGYISNVALSAQTIVTTILNIQYMVESAWASAATTVVGNLLGANKPHTAALASRSTCLCGVLLVVVQAGAVLGARVPIAEAFAGKNMDVRKHTIALLPIATIFQIFDGMQNCITGIITAAGEQRRAMPVITVAYWVVGLPLAAGFEFGLSWGLDGVWWGMIIGVVIHATVYSYILCTMDWSGAAADAATRTKDSVCQRAPLPAPLTAEAAAAANSDHDHVDDAGMKHTNSNPNPNGNTTKHVLCESDVCIREPLLA